MYTALTTGSTALDPAIYGPGVNPYVIKTGQVVQDCSRKRRTILPIPCNLHGYRFQVVARGPGSWDGDEATFAFYTDGTRYCCNSSVWALGPQDFDKQSWVYGSVSLSPSSVLSTALTLRGPLPHGTSSCRGNDGHVHRVARLDAENRPSPASATADL